MREDDRTGVSETRPDRQYRMPPCPIHSQFRVVGHDLGGRTHRTCPLSDFEPRSTWLKGATWEIPVYSAIESARPRPREGTRSPLSAPGLSFWEGQVAYIPGTVSSPGTESHGFCA